MKYSRTFDLKFRYQSYLSIEMFSYLKSDPDDDDDDDEELVRQMVDQSKGLSFICSRDHYHRFSLLQTSNTCKQDFKLYKIFRI